MLDDYVNEQPIAVSILKNSVKDDKTVHAYLFETNGYNKKDDFIFSFIKSLLCPNKFFVFNNCENCHICQMINDKCYPEIKIINPDGLWIKKEQLDELQKEFSTKAVFGTKKIYIINEAEKMNSSAANSILKFLEEPVPNIIAILVTNNIYQLLDTIISRCQVISLRKNKLNFESNEELIAHQIFSQPEKQEEFLNNLPNVNYIDCVKKFVEYYEKNGINTMLYTQKLWFSFFNDKEKNIMAFDIMILIYRDILNYVIGHGLMIFKNDIHYISNISKNNTEYSICEKITKILNAKNKIKNNINLNLLMDNLIMELDRR